MQYTINELRQEIFGKVYEVYEIFQNFFGEGFTDLQGVPDDNLIVDVIYSCTDIEEVEPASIELSEEDFATIESRFNINKPVIMVWWPEVTVTNENDRSVRIQDLYAKIEVTMEGRIPYEYGGFKLIRTTFSEIQFKNGYLHSHIPRFSGVPTFEAPCLGSGPINHTIMDLKNGYEETLWMLFCQELSLYVTVESLRGGPYFRMENIGEQSLLNVYSIYDSSISSIGKLLSFYHSAEKKEMFLQILKYFICYYLEHGNLCFNYSDGQFVPGMPCYDYIIDISNSFIEFINSVYSDREKYTENEIKEVVTKLYEDHILIKAHVANGNFYQASDGNFTFNDINRYEGSEMFRFKGEMKHLHIIHEEAERIETSTLLNSIIAMFILNRVLTIINYRYKNEHDRKQISATTGTTASGESSSPYKRVFYI